MTAGHFQLPDAISKSLFRIAGGPNQGPPVILLHGFAGSSNAWADVTDHFGTDCRWIAFDLPGHGGSADVRPVGNAAVCARAIQAELEGMDCHSYHLAGHSMGGATAAILALMAPEACRSLTLLAPGGFGPEVNHRMLRQMAVARERPLVKILMEQFFGWQEAVPERFIDAAMRGRDSDQVIEALQAIANSLIDGCEQKQLPLDKIAALECPIKVIWGTQDQILPTRHAHRLPGRIAVHVFERVGHMLPQELPAEMAALIAENAALSGSDLKPLE